MDTEYVKMEQIIKEIDTRMNYTSQNRKDHVITGRTFRNHIEAYNSTHRPEEQVKNISKQKTNGALYERSKIEKVIEYNIEKIEKLAKKKEKYRLGQEQIEKIINKEVNKRINNERERYKDEAMSGVDDFVFYQSELLALFDLKKLFKDSITNSIKSEQLYLYLKSDIILMIQDNKKKD